MLLIAEKLAKMRFGWNERPLDEREAERICKKFKVSVTEMPLTTRGFYYRVMGRDFIAIDSRLKGVERLMVLFHELGHFLLHTPESGATANFHHIGKPTRIEREADAFALCALIPKVRIESSEIEHLADEGFTPENIAERLALYREYGI